MTRVLSLALVLGVGACVLALSCGAAQSKDQIQLGVIVAGCKASLDLDRDAGAADAVDDETNACRETQHVWETRP